MIMTKYIYQHLPKCITFSAVCFAFALAGCNNTMPLESALAGQASQPIANANTINHTNSQYANKRFLTIDNNNYPIAETSARLLTNADGTAPELVDDIYSGQASTPVAGYKLMVINRTSSLASEGRVRDGAIVDNRMVHRGSKALIGIPVSNGQAQLSQAVLLDLDIIYDNPSQPLAEGEVIKPRGQRLTKADTAVHNKQLKIHALTLPNFVSGENAGGGIDFEASAVIDGKVVRTGANSAFQIFDTTTPDKARGF
ncbi:hypothetical protein [Psychrobacter sp. I-STPA6b]|uniref:hypothetical protein n=1 Tax=Psychrobacter sp. I-STPA6b TaxID=2585718 RepID=UPI001D0CB97D|nr:hypothetical protein [Psychrobacter sp. I-STPA6b]